MQLSPIALEMPAQSCNLAYNCYSASSFGGQWKANK